MRGAMRRRPRAGPVMLLLQQRLLSKCQSVLAGPANHERTFPAEWGSVLVDQVCLSETRGHGPSWLGPRPAVKGTGAEGCSSLFVPECQMRFGCLGNAARLRCRVVVARGGHAEQTMGRKVTAASLAGLHGRGLVQAGLWAGEVEAEAGVDASTCARLPEHRFPALVHVLRNVAGQQAGVVRCLLLRAGLNASLECYDGASI